MCDMKPTKFLIFFSKKNPSKVVLRLFLAKTRGTSFKLVLNLGDLSSPQNFKYTRGSSRTTTQLRFTLLAIVVERLLKNGLVF